MPMCERLCLFVCVYICISCRLPRHVQPNSQGEQSTFRLDTQNRLTHIPFLSHWNGACERRQCSSLHLSHTHIHSPPPCLLQIVIYLAFVLVFKSRSYIHTSTQNMHYDKEAHTRAHAQPHARTPFPLLPPPHIHT